LLIILFLKKKLPGVSTRYTGGSSKTLIEVTATDRVTPGKAPVFAAFPKIIIKGI
jgi:hypothetical protein